MAVIVPTDIVMGVVATYVMVIAIVVVQIMFKQRASRVVMVVLVDVALRRLALLSGQSLVGL
ncbi:hypothetical protein [Gordonia effusa]|uniref:hypothetical protein n=1 Tax=Gordonia effusa TaxID=263908 RepID=UPI001B8B6E1A|nr:hypothetical protein [Gordonia effusa]